MESETKVKISDFTVHTHGFWIISFYPIILDGDYGHQTRFSDYEVSAGTIPEKSYDKKFPGFI